MGSNQETLIYIEDKDRLDASVAANSFAHSEIKNRVYMNTLGAKLGMKYLASEDIDVSNVYNMHSIKKILEEVDIADIMLSNIHIDVRVVYNENAIFIPKTHFEYGLTPDIYLVFQIAKDFSCVTFLGYFEPSLINKNNANADYYFIEKEKLSPAASLKKFISNFNGNTNITIPENEVENSERIIMAMADNDVSDEDRKYLIKQLTKSAELRDKFIEYENFETLSYKAMTDPTISKKEINKENSINISALENINELDDIQKIEETNAEPELANIENFEDITLDDIFDNGVLENNIEKIDDETPQENQTDVNNSNSSDNIVGDIAGTIAGAAVGTAAGGAIGGAISATAGEILNSISAAESTIDTVGEVANAVSSISETASNGIDSIKSGIDSIKDIAETSNIEETQPESISLEDVDISNMESIELPQENNENETISLNDVEISDEINTDFIDSIDNKISFDNIELPDENIDISSDDIQPLNIDEQMTSAKDELPEISENIAEPLEEKEDSSEVEDISANEIENLDLGVAENIEPLEEPSIDQLELLDENIEPLDKTVEPINEEIEEEEGLKLLDTNIPDNIEDSTLKNENQTVELPQEEPSNLEELNLDSIDDLINPENANSETTPVDSSNENEASEISNGFGDALLNNLTNEELENITIDDLGITDEESSVNIDNISSNDLLSQIDDVLNSSATQDEPINETVDTNETPTIDELSTDNGTTESSDVTDLSIDDLLDELGDETTNSETSGETSEDNDKFSALADEQHQLDVNTQENIPFDEIHNSLEEVENNSAENFEEIEEAEENGESEEEENGNLEMLFNDTDTESDMDLDEITSNEAQTVPGQALFPEQKKQSNQKTLIVAAALATVVAASSAVMFLKAKNSSTSDVEPLNQKQNEIVANQTPAAPASTDDMLATNTPNINQNTTQVTQTKQQVKELKNTTMNKKPATSGSYLQVNKLVWNVPDNLSYNPKMQNYLRTTGKSLKLALSADLLLASEYAYTNQMKVNLKMSSNGDIQQATIGSSSGSTQIDNIVLQSVKDTLSAVKPPVDELKGQNFNLALIIYF